MRLLGADTCVFTTWATCGRWQPGSYVHMTQRNPLQVPSGHMHLCEYA